MSSLRYSLNKYLSVRRSLEFNRLISCNASMKIIYQNIMAWLTHDIKKTDVDNEKNAFKNIFNYLHLLKNSDKRIWKIENLNWNYGTSWSNLKISLGELEIERGQTICDTFKEINEAFSSFGNFDVVPSHSIDEIGLRIVDIIIGFARKLILELLCNARENKGKFNTDIFIDDKTIIKIQEKKKLLIEFRKLFNNKYWSTFPVCILMIFLSLCRF